MGERAVAALDSSLIASLFSTGLGERQTLFCSVNLGSWELLL
jgi:hypothetical protein